MEDEKEAHTKRLHSILGGSSAHRWVNCTGSVFHDCPPDEPTEAALLGTKAHEVAEIVLEDFISYKINGTDPDIRSHLVSTDTEMLEHIKSYRDIIWKEVLEETITGKAYGVEEAFVLDSGLNMGGILDFWVIYIDERGKRVGAISDLKYGFTQVPAEKNAQLAFYACCLREEIKRRGKDLDYIKASIFQPRIQSDTHYQEIKFTQKELDTWRKRFFRAAEEIFVEKKPKFKLGHWCKFCPAQSVCVLYAKDLEKKTSLMLVNPEEETLPTVESLSDEVLYKLIVHGNRIREYLDGAYSYSLNRARNGDPIRGTKLVHGASRRTWQKDSAHIGEELKTKGISEPFDTKLKNLTTVEKELGTILGRDEAKRVVDSLCDKTVPNLKLVTEDDPREEIEGNLSLLD